MNTDSINREHAAITYARSLVTGAGFFWRITGPDIGIDAMIEMTDNDAKDDNSKGLLLLQVKSGEVKHGQDQSTALRVRHQGRHRQYWITQPLPLAICVAPSSLHGGYNLPDEGYWIDYRAVHHRGCRTSLSLPLPDEHVLEDRDLNLSITDELVTSDIGPLS